MFEKPQAAHAWLTQLAGDWDVETEASMGPGQETKVMKTRLQCRQLSGMWIVAESEGTIPEGTWTNIITLGFDPRQQRYVGTFVSSNMAYLWPYSGALDASGKKLPLDSEGPKFDGSGTTKYRDTIEIVDKDHWIFSGEVLADDGSWQTLMTSHHRRA